MRSSPTCCSCTARRRRSAWSTVRTRFGLPVMKALPIAERADLSPIRLYDKVADRLIFDARAPREATRPGGARQEASTGGSSRTSRPRVPFMLSGGLDAGNVAEALRITRAPGVDVSSGVERAPGEKDPRQDPRVRRRGPRRAGTRRTDASS